MQQFEESTGFMTSKIEETEESKENMQEQIGKKEEKWKQICMDIDKYEQTLLKLGEDMINAIGSNNEHATLTKVCEQKFEYETKRAEKLKQELANSDETKVN